MKKILFAISICLLCGPTLAQSNGNHATVTVQKIEGFSESGDAFSFKATNGKRYRVYNAGGAQPIQGEELISKSVKTKKAVCLHLDTDKTEPRLVQSVAQGRCK